jgi:ligand-binding sensor domain-containing protein/class 3 adenylate cyclase/predicted metal-dependent HD superfamily phosphohydrolase
MHIACCWLFMFVAVAAQAQNNDIKFQNISILDGLSQSYVNQILQDRQGFMWVATQDGLNQYDGYSFKVYKNDPSDPYSIAHNYVHAVYEDNDSSIWVGTDVGLSRFDKATRRFENYYAQPKNPEGLSNEIVWAIAEDAEGYLWIGTEHGGLNRFDPKTGIFKQYKQGPGAKDLPNNTVTSLVHDSDGQMWIGTFGGLCRYNLASDNFTVYKNNPNDPASLSNNVVVSLATDADGTLWVGTNDGLNSMHKVGNGEVFRRYYHDPENMASLGENTITSLYSSSFGPMWVGTRGGGLTRMITGGDEPQFNTYRHDDFDQYSLIQNQVMTIYEDRSGSMWVGTYNGISRFDPEKQGFSHIKYDVNNTNSLPDKNVWSFSEGSNGDLWVCTRAGLTRIDRPSSKFSHYSRVTNNLKSLKDNSALSVHVDSKGVVWVGMTDGLFRLDNWADPVNYDFIPVEFRDSVSAYSDNRTYTIMEGRDGYLWVGFREGMARINPENLSFQHFNHDPSDPNSLSDNIVRCLYQMSDGSIWAGTDGAGFCEIMIEGAGDSAKISFKRHQHSAEDPSSISNHGVTSMQEGAAGSLWLGTYGGGIVKYDAKDGTFTPYRERDGLANNVVYGVLADDYGNLWCSTNLGLSKFNKTDRTFRNYVLNDGLQSSEYNIGAYFGNSKGEMFFGGINGFNAFYPEEIRNNTRAPEVVITDFQLFNKDIGIGGESPLKKHISLTESIELNYRQNNITIRFAALHFSDPQKNQYEYILENHDEMYTNVGNRREVYFTNMPDGEYIFRVRGSSSDGVWSSEEATLRIVIHPPFWLRWWFYVIWIVSVISIVFAGFRFRINRIKAQKIKLERLVNIRTQEVQRQKEKIESQKADLEVEKEKAEKLLLNILPEETVEELKANGKATARSYRRATVMFTDFKGFTQISEKLAPTELVARLDNYFIEFDKIIEKYGIEKIKTIGDAYMCAGGVPIRNKSNPVDTVLAGLDIQRYMLRDKAGRQGRGEDYWELRIGIHTGEIIAGVIGAKRFAYDIWGDTVNVSSRLESGCEPGKVNISGMTYSFIQPLFDCTYRGKIAAKNKGEIGMYYVEQIRPELSVDGKGEIPNQKFDDYVNLILYSNINYRNAEKFILKLLEEKLPENLHYHGVHHTLDVTRAAEMLALREGVTGEELYLLKTAALYHDAGFCQQYSANEPVGVKMSQEILPNFGYTEEQIEIISGLIHVTAIPHDPKNHLQQIMCDADLDYLGRDDFDDISVTLKQELMDKEIVKDSRHWDEIQVKFFNMHKFFTKTSIGLRNEKKAMHLREVEQRLADDNYPELQPREDEA